MEATDDRKVPEDVRQLAEAALYERACSPDQDPVLSIIRVHLLAEHHLERLMHLHMIRADRLLSNLSFSQKIRAVEALVAMPYLDRLTQCLRGLNKVRNRCAHDFDKKITMADIDLIGRPLGTICTKYRQEACGDVSQFQFRVSSYLCGALAGYVTSHEDQAVSKLDVADSSDPPPT